MTPSGLLSPLELSRDRFIFLTAKSFCLSSAHMSPCAAQTQITYEKNSNIEIFLSFNLLILANNADAIVD